jgi:hypothetical protein
LNVSAMKTVPSGPTAAARGWWKAADTAEPPSPEKPRWLVPAIVRMTPPEPPPPLSVPPEV